MKLKPVFWIFAMFLIAMPLIYADIVDNSGATQPTSAFPVTQCSPTVINISTTGNFSVNLTRLVYACSTNCPDRWYIYRGTPSYNPAPGTCDASFNNSLRLWNGTMNDLPNGASNLSGLNIILQKGEEYALAFDKSGSNYGFMYGPPQWPKVGSSGNITYMRTYDGAGGYDSSPRGLSGIQFVPFYNLSSPSNNAFAFNGSSIPANGHSFSQLFMNFSQNATLTNNTMNCSLILNGVFNETKQYSNLSNSTYWFNITYDKSLAAGEYNYSISCKSLIDNTTTNTTQATFYLDATFPSIQTTFSNRSVYFLNNLTASFNFTDDFYLNSFNISIDGVQIAGNDSLTGTSFQYNLSTNISNLSAGSHTLKVRTSDGHTANQIPDYEVSTGLFNDHLEFGYQNQGRKSVRISKADGSIFDTFTTAKQKDRYVWDFEPSAKKSSYDFIVDTDDDIRIIRDNSTYLKAWITFGNKWMDFDLYGENTTIDIQKISNKQVRVRVSNIKNPEKQKYHSIGDLNIIEVNYTFYKMNASYSYQSTIFEGSSTSLLLNLSMTNMTFFNSSASLVWNGTYKSVSKTNISNDSVQFSSSFIVPGGLPSVVNWTWIFNVSGSSFNISGNSSFIAINITNCSAGTYIVLNYTVYDQETQALPNASAVNITIENDLILTSSLDSSQKWNFSIKYLGNGLLICLPNGTLNASDYILDAVTKYDYSSHVVQYHYVDGFNLTAAAIPKVIKLYDLATAKSTSFLITYQNENYIYVEGVIVDLLRKYVSQSGQFLSVEHGRTDSGGQTRLHFTTEDIIYKVNVWQDGVLQYTSGEFFALCQTTPCQINFKKPSSQNASVSDTANIVYSITDDVIFESSQQTIFDFSTKDGTSSLIEMNVTRFSAYNNETICSVSTTASSGSLSCSIPPAYSNSTYRVKIYKDGKFIGYKTYSLDPRPQFGRNTSMFLAGFGFLTLTMMGFTDGIIMIVLGVVSIIAMGLIFILDTGAMFGVGSSIIWLVIAAGILIYKIVTRRRR